MSELRINAKIEKDIIPFLVRNYLWDKETNEPSKSLILLEWVEKKESIQERTYTKNGVRYFYYWHFTQKGKDSICKLIQGIY